MKKFLLSTSAVLCMTMVFGQNEILNSFKLNTDNTFAEYNYSDRGNTGFTTMSVYGDVTELWYDDEYVYVVCEGLPTTTMGPWRAMDLPSGQGYTVSIPINPVENTSSDLDRVLAKGIAGFAIDGVTLFGNSSAESYSTANEQLEVPGDNVWHEDAYVGESHTFDALLGHPQGQGVYHYHVTPIDLYDADNSGEHSPIIGWAADGFPIYGPYGYSDPMDTSSGIRRMETNYSLRNIAVRETLPDGTVLSASEYGPEVSNEYPLGTFLEDHAYDASNGGDLDEHNGRYCYTPEYPNGIYAYFVTMDVSGNPEYPYIFGETYYGVMPFVSVFAMAESTIPNDAIKWDGVSTNIHDFANDEDIVRIFPNPAQEYINVQSEKAIASIQIFNAMGQLVAEMNNTQQIEIGHFPKGVYQIRVLTEDNHTLTDSFIKD